MSAAGSATARGTRGVDAEGSTPGPGRPRGAARPAASSGVVRFSLGSVGDLDVTPGTTLAECREAVDALLGPSAGAELTVAGRPLAAEQVAGVPPWVPGAHVEVGLAPADGAGDPSHVAAAAWHVAVVAGPDAGAVAAPGPDGRLDVGRGPGPGPARLALTDPAVSRGHAVLVGRGRTVVVRDRGSANRTWRRRPPRGQPRRVRLPWSGRWRRVRGPARLRAGDRLRLGGTELELRRDVVPAQVVAPAPGRGRAERAGRGADRLGEPGGRPGGDRPAEPGAVAGRVAGALTPVLLAVTMAAVTGSPVFLLMAATAPLTMAAPAVCARLARHRRGRPAVGLGPDPAALTVLLAGAGTRPETGPPPWWSLAREGLVVRGSEAAVAAAGRALVGGAVVDPSTGLTVLHDARRTAEWRWARWLAPRLGGGARARVAAAGHAAFDGVGDRHLVVADGTGPWRTDLDRWWWAAASGGREGDRAALVLVRGDEPAPAWCRWLLTVTGDGVAQLTGPGLTTRLAAPVASAAWAEAHARRLAARDALAARACPEPAAAWPPGRAADPGAELPLRVGPGAVGLPGDADEVCVAWGGPGAGGRALTGLRVPIGMAAGPRGPAPAWLDLLTDGPHALVAGTTGSGKSELLQALVLGLALRHPPTELGLVLLDFKGGAGLRACADLPHVVGRVSDLDPEQAVRALEALAAELRRRERLLAAAGVSDLETLRGAAGHRAPPRLLVVVDEFRALAEDLPDFVPGLVRLAAQGRSLGMHLVLATQRPAGAVTAQMRANLALRICLRVTEPADSHDVVDVPDAAALPARAPGRAVVRRADGRVEVVQTVWTALPSHHEHPVRPARPWEAFGRPWPPTAPSVAHDGTAALAALATTAADRLPVRAHEPLWSPPLPAVVDARELEAAADAADLVLGLTDPPGAGPRGLLTWDGRGLLLVAGGPGSGRTTAAARAGAVALAAGRHVHAVGPVARLLPADHPALGTGVDGGDPRRLTRLLTLLATTGTGPDTGSGAGPAAPRDAGPGPLLLIDDVASAVAALDRMPRGAGADLLERLARDARRHGLGVLVTGHPRDLMRLAPLAAARLVLPVADAGDDAGLGVPRDLAARTLPGRGVLVAGGAPVRCHVALPSTAPPRVDGRTGRPLRLRPIPEQVARATTGTRWSVAVGAGGDEAGRVTVDVRRGVLVVGPPGSGRTTALTTLVLGLAGAGLRVGVVAREGPLANAARGAALPSAGSPAGALALVERSGPGALDVLAVDDLDALARAAPDLDDRLASWVQAVERGEAAPVVLATCRTDRAASAYRGTVAALRGASPVLVLSPLEAGSAEVAGTDLASVCDPALPRHPGRGALVVHGRATPVQVAQR
ncbi:hypothetical protein AFE02nite_33830 [Actinotalea fermentans]|uniref:FtsK domain-containing protein n=1 Tax=Actinotalea fermentans TaxID=43671 RepID=A0A511Z2H5_9CELL|nr:hypothetical protein AFE02nite_33830 [Actinotalea fermentans]